MVISAALQLRRTHDHLYFDQGFGLEEIGYADERRRGFRIQIEHDIASCTHNAQALRVDSYDKVVDFHNIGLGSTEVSENGLQVLEHLCGLGGEIAGTNKASVLIFRDLAGHERQASLSDRDI